MADSKISALTAASALDGTELVPVVRGGVTKRTTSAAMVLLPSGVVYSTAYADLDTAVSNIGATPTTLIVNSSFTVTNNVTVPSTLFLLFYRNGSLSVPTGKTVTINGPLEAPLSKIFNLTGTGVVVFTTNQLKELWAEWWGAVGDDNPSTDNATAIQAALIGAGSTKLRMGSGGFYYQTALTIPSNTWFTGNDSNGSFATALRPKNCAALIIDNIHHSLVEHLMIWPADNSTPPARYINIGSSAYAYTIELSHIRFQLDTAGSTPTAAVITQTSGQVLYNNIIMRTSGAGGAPIGFEFLTGCGSADLLTPDIEVMDRGIKYSGGRVSVFDSYMESMGVNGIDLAGGETDGYFIGSGGSFNSSNAGVPLAIRDGAKNAYISGVQLTKPDLVYQGYIYGLSGSSNIRIGAVNYDPAQWDGAVSASEGVVTFPVLIPPSKFTSINVAGPATFSAGDLTGARAVYLTSTNAAPGTLTTRTAVQMRADHLSGISLTSYTLRI